MITYIIIIITVLVSILGFKDKKMFYKLSLSPYRIAKNREWYRLLTHSLLHGDYMHLFINMFVFWSFGSAIEHMFGLLKQEGIIRNAEVNFILLYVGGVIFSAIPDLIKRRNQYAYNSIGASGAVSSILFASIFFNPWGTISLFGVIPIPAIIFGVLYVIYESYLDKKGGDNINHKAHLWGALYGFIYIILMDYKLIYIFINELLNPKF